MFQSDSEIRDPTDVLALSGSRSHVDVVPKKATVITGVGGVIPVLPTACVALLRGSKSKVREVGIADASNVLSGTDRVQLVARYEPKSSPLKPASPPEAPDSRKVLLGDSVHLGNSGEGQGTSDCVPGPGPNGFLEPRPREETKVRMISEIDNVLCDVKSHDLCSADIPSAAVVTPGPGLRSPHPVVSLASVADHSESPEAVKIDISLEEYRGLADGRSVGDGGMRVYGEQDCDSVTTCKEKECFEAPAEKANCVSVDPGTDKQGVLVTLCEAKSSVVCSSAITATSTSIVDSGLCITEERPQGEGANLIQSDSTPLAVAADSTEFLGADTFVASPEELRCCANRCSAEDE
ncbi:hypothetical protein AB205_0106260, partial [Aquarana catesbeiana]